MENLLKPDFGVLLLTVCNFLLLVYLLKKFAWGPVIGALEKREKRTQRGTGTVGCNPHHCGAGGKDPRLCSRGVLVHRYHPLHR